MNNKVELIDFKTMVIALKEGLYVLGINRKQKVLITMINNTVYVKNNHFSVKYNFDDFLTNYKDYQFYLIYDENETAIDANKDYDYYAFWRK